MRKTCKDETLRSKDRKKGQKEEREGGRERVEGSLEEVEKESLKSRRGCTILSSGDCAMGSNVSMLKLER